MTRPETDATVRALAARTGFDPGLLMLAIQAALSLLAACQTPQAVQAFLRADGLWWIPGVREGAVARRKRRYVDGVAAALPPDIVPAKRREVAEAAYAETMAMESHRLGAIMREHGR